MITKLLTAYGEMLHIIHPFNQQNLMIGECLFVAEVCSMEDYTGSFLDPYKNDEQTISKVTYTCGEGGIPIKLITVQNAS